ncbi:MAG: hypothetical protein WD904_10360 [Dehalococcoidia bacterium]
MAEVQTALETMTAKSAALDAWQQQVLTEADTRCKIVDVILKDVLGWQEEAIRRESRTPDGAFQDYHLESNRNRLILEAKRTGPYFELPPGQSLRLRRDGMRLKSVPLFDALQQVAAYCRASACAVGVASNGTQFAVTRVYRPAGAGSGYDTIVFNGTAHILGLFELFWSMLSPDGDAEQTLKRVLAGSEFIRPAPQYSESLVDHIVMRDETMNRNPVDVTLAPIIQHYFTDLLGDDKRDVLRRGYVESGRQAQYGKQFDSLLEDVIPHSGDPIREIETTKKASPTMDEVLSLDLNEKSGPEGRVLLLVGGVGSGKTSFEHRYFEFLINSELRDKVVPVFLDFTKTSEGTDLGRFTDQQVKSLLEARDPQLAEWDALTQIYEKEISVQRKGVLAPVWESNRERYWELISEEMKSWLADFESHVSAVIRSLRLKRGKTVCVVFDNVDQLGQELQHEAIRVAFQKCGLWRCLGILTIREETYWRFRNSPPLDAYHRFTYHISSPRITNVLSRRLEIAKEDRGSLTVTLRSQAGIQVSGISVGEFLEIMVDSFLGEDQRNIILLEALSAGNVRLGLDMFSEFLLSGHTNTDEYIKAHLASGTYAVPFHHVFRSVALAERRYYDSSRSLIANLFSLEDDGFYSHFQKIRTLRYLNGCRHIEAPPGRGFVEVPRLYDAFAALMSDEEGLRRVLDPLLKHRLIEAANGYGAHGESADLVRITSAGNYYVDTLLNEFAYLDLTSIDTPIKSASAFASLN